jgi:hypothetical protein
MVMVFGLVPWTVRNYGVAHRFVPLGTINGETLWQSSLQWTGVISPAFTVADQKHLHALARPLAARIRLRDAREHSTVPYDVRVDEDIESALAARGKHTLEGLSPGQVLRKGPVLVGYLWAVGDFPPTGSASFWHPVGQLQYALLVALLVVGLASLIHQRRLRAHWPLLVLPIYLTVVHLIFHVEPRFTLPTRPDLLIISAVGLLHGYRWASARIAQRRTERLMAEPSR